MLSIATALRQLYSGAAPSGPRSAELRNGNADNVLIRSRTYGHVRTWIVGHDGAAAVITAIRLLHTVIFVQLLGLVLVLTTSGLRGRATRWTRVAAFGVAGEVGVVLVNQGRCPLTVVVEDLGAEHGSVSDILLPDRAARHIPHISTGLILIGLVGLVVRRLTAR